MQMEDIRNARILVVDDQEPNILLLEDILDEGGYTQRKSIQDAREALRTFAEFQPDLVLLDLMMPHLDGFAVMEQLQPLLEKEAYLPILVLTADANVEVKRRALRAGAKDFLTKPLDPVEVLLRIRNLLMTRFLYRQMQQRADERVRELADLIDRANDAILVQKSGGEIAFWNEGAQRLYGWLAAEALGRDANELLFKAPCPGLEEAQQRVQAEGKWSGEFEQVTKEGKKVVVASRWTMVRAADNGPATTLVINTDITEKKRLEALFLQAQRMEGIGVLAGGVAHDFNNLLTIILGCSEVMLRALPEDDPSLPLVSEVHKAGQRAASLTRQLLAFCRKQVLVPIVLDLNRQVVEIEKMLHRLIGEDIDLDSALDPALGHIKADPGQIEQILVNLAANARDAMPQGGQLTIETQNVELDEVFVRRDADIRPGPYVLLAVSDTGSGMDEATKAHIFDPFFTTKEIGKGTGLGLATVYGIVKQSGGHIDVYSEPGCGTTFKIYLPRVSQPETAREVSFSSLPLAKGSETILLAEDEANVRALARLALQTAGYQVLEACDGADALHVSQQHPGRIDLLVTDVVMPKKNGRQLAELLMPLRPNMKVLYLSGYTDDAIVRHGVLQAKMAFLNKPFSVVALTRKVREVLDQAQPVGASLSPRDDELILQR